MSTYTINIDLDKKCPRCHKRGTVNGGICLKCMTKAIQSGEIDHIINKRKAKTADREG